MNLTHWPTFSRFYTVLTSGWRTLPDFQVRYFPTAYDKVKVMECAHPRFTMCVMKLCEENFVQVLLWAWRILRQLFSRGKLVRKRWIIIKKSYCFRLRTKYFHLPDSWRFPTTLTMNKQFFWRGFYAGTFFKRWLRAWKRAMINFRRLLLSFCAVRSATRSLLGNGADSWIFRLPGICSCERIIGNESDINWRNLRRQSETPVGIYVLCSGTCHYRIIFWRRNLILDSSPLRERRWRMSSTFDFILGNAIS